MQRSSSPGCWATATSTYQVPEPKLAGTVRCRQPPSTTEMKKMLHLPKVVLKRGSPLLEQAVAGPTGTSTPAPETMMVWLFVIAAALPGRSHWQDLEKATT